MRIGVIVQLNGTPDEGPRWDHLRAQAGAAEAAGFDLLVFEDAFQYPGAGLWHASVVAGAVAASTGRIDFGHSVVNAPFEHPARIAQMAATADEVSDGRFILGIGAGNTPDDYEVLAIDADPRYSRFAEALDIVHRLLRTGEATFEGAHHRVEGAELRLRGPREGGLPIVVAAGGPKMIRLTARYGDGWNWWGALTGDPAGNGERLSLLDAACAEEGRDPAEVHRSVDLYSVDPLGVTDDDRPGHVLASQDPDEIADRLAAFGEAGFDEVRVSLAGGPDDKAPGIAALAPVVAALHGT